MTTAPYPVGLPPAGLPLQLAGRVIGQESGLRRAILRDLQEKPRRFADLRHLIKDRYANNLTEALRWLQVEGLIDRRTDARSRPPVHLYQLSSLGILVLQLLEEIEALGRQPLGSNSGKTTAKAVSKSSQARPRCPKCGAVMAPLFCKSPRGSGFARAPGAFVCRKDEVVGKGKDRVRFLA